VLSTCAAPNRAAAGRPASCGSRPDRALTSLTAIVADYIEHYRPIRLAERRFYAKRPTWGELLETVAANRDMYGRCHAHQRRIRRPAKAAMRRVLLATDLRPAATFAELIGAVEAAIGGIKGIKAVTVYDASLRLGARLGLEPEVVYLHGGTRDGAKALGLKHRRATLAMEELPVELQSLRPYEVEDLLCIYKAQLWRIVSGPGRA
jgi:hypothetical protein